MMFHNNSFLSSSSAGLLKAIHPNLKNPIGINPCSNSFRRITPSMNLQAFNWRSSIRSTTNNSIVSLGSRIATHGLVSGTSKFCEDAIFEYGNKCRVTTKGFTRHSAVKLKSIIGLVSDVACDIIDVLFEIDPKKNNTMGRTSNESELSFA